MQKLLAISHIAPGTMYAFCDGDACIIDGSKETSKIYILKLASRKITDYHIKKTRYGEILKGLLMAAAYAFDKKAYDIFYPIAKADGQEVFELFRAEDNTNLEDSGIPLKRVQWKKQSFIEDVHK